MKRRMSIDTDIISLPEVDQQSHRVRRDLDFDMQAVNVIKEAKFPPRIGRETTLLDDFLRLVADRPDAVGLVRYFAGRGEPVALTYRQMGEEIGRASGRERVVQ